MDERIIGKDFEQINKSNLNQMYRIISETCKSKLESGMYNNEMKYFTSTKLLNQDKFFGGTTNIELIYDLSKNTDSEIINILHVENIKIRTRAKNKDILNSCRNMCFPSNCNTIRCIFYVFFMYFFQH